MRKSKISSEKKLEIVMEYLSGKVGYKESVRLAGNSKSAIRRWVFQYKTGGAAAFLPQEKNNCYSPETKLAAVRSYLSGEGSQEKISEKYGLRSSSQLRQWIREYNAHGDFNSVKQSGGGSYMKQGRETTQEERIQIAKECISRGKNYGEMALKYQVSYQQVRTWTLRYEQMGEAGLEDRRGQRKKDQTPRTELELAQIEIEQLKHKLYLAEMENTLLKKLDEVKRRDASQK